MSPNAQKLLDEARRLPAAERDWLIENLLGERGAMSDEAFAAWQKEVGETRERAVLRTSYVMACRIHSESIRVLRVVRGARRWPSRID